MSLLLGIALLLQSLLIVPTTQSSGPSFRTVSSYRDTLVIRVAKGDWGDSDIEDMQKVLYSAANELLPFFPHKRLNPIIVEYTEGNPITLYERGPNGEYIVRLNSRDRHWVQLAYQFSHEFCHVMAMNNKVTDNPNQWFEESLGETASLFVLKRMAITWRTSPPYSNWKSFAPAFQRYVDNLMNDQARQMPRNMTFAEWYRANSNRLRANPYLRDKNAIVASQLLSLLEENPDNWEAVSYLNMEKANPSQSFRSYLDGWSEYAPTKYENFIRAIADLFDV